MTSGERAALDLGQFSNLDASKSAASFLDDLDRRDRLPSSIAVRARLYEMLEAHPGDRIADVGCGTGKVVADLIEAGADATGVDVKRPGVTTEQQRRIAELERENRELRRTNEILKAASAFFAYMPTMVSPCALAHFFTAQVRLWLFLEAPPHKAPGPLNVI